MKSYKIAVASDHAGFAMKEFVIGFLMSAGHTVKDCGCYSEQSVDYPDYAHKLAADVVSGDAEFGVALCGSANGITMSLNKHNGIRAAICWKSEIATLARAHNDANVCSLPARFLNEVEAVQILEAFFSTPFEGGRHAARVCKIDI